MTQIDKDLEKVYEVREHAHQVLLDCDIIVDDILRKLLDDKPEGTS